MFFNAKSAKPRSKNTRSKHLSLKLDLAVPSEIMFWRGKFWLMFSNFIFFLEVNLIVSRRLGDKVAVHSGGTYIKLWK